MTLRVFISKHPCDGQPFIDQIDPDPRSLDELFDPFGPDYSGWYVLEKDKEQTVQ